MRLVVLLLVLVQAAWTINYEDMLGGLWEQSDADGDGALSSTEFDKALEKLGIESDFFTEHSGSKANFFADSLIDTDGSGKLSQAELAGAIDAYPAYEDGLKAAFTNGAGSVPTSIPTPTATTLEAKAKVTMELELAGSPSDIYPGQRAEIKAWFATTCGVSTSDVIVTFLAADSARRKLQSGGVIVKGTAFVPDNAAAEAASAALPTDASGFEATSAFEGLSVTSASVGADLEWDLPISTAAIVGVVLLVASLLMCFGASKYARAKSKAAGVKGDCCKAGCCSFFAVKPWAFGEFTSALVIAGCVFYLYTNMTGLTETILGLIDTLLALATSSIPAIQDLTSALPSAILDTIAAYRSQVSLLPFAVMGPGAIAIIALLAGAICPMVPKNKGSYCGTKFMILFSDVFLGLGLIFYSIFALIAVILKYAPPTVQSQINSITGLCDTIPPWIQQMVADNSAALDKLAAAGQDVSELQTTLDEVAFLSSTISDGCTYLNGFFTEFQNLFLPGLMCIVAIVFALFVNNTLCCAAGCCCKGPPKAASTSKTDVSQSV